MADSVGVGPWSTMLPRSSEAGLVLLELDELPPLSVVTPHTTTGRDQPKAARRRSKGGRISKRDGRGGPGVLSVGPRELPTRRRIGRRRGGHHVGASVGRGEAPWAMGKRIGGGVRLASWGRAQLGQMRELGFLEKSLVQSMANPLLIH
ncbi:hypothetical protein VPH35_085995 [Triticum aestivum]